MEIKSCDNDTRALLRECSAGSRMAIGSIDGMISAVENDKLRGLLNDCRRDHQRTCDEADGLLRRFGEDGSTPPHMARAMAWMKVNLKVNGESADANAASIAYDGCSSGIRTLSKCINENPGAGAEAMELADEIMRCERQTMEDVRKFL